jgi:hypothetical protein
MSELVPRATGRASVSNAVVGWRMARETQRALDVVQARGEVTVARVQTAAEEAAAVVHARNAVAAAAAQDDTVLGGILNALPIYDVTDADFRSQLRQATRAGVIADVLRFQP